MSNKKHNKNYIPKPPRLTPYTPIPKKTWKFYSKGPSFFNKKSKQFYQYYFFAIILLFIIGFIVTYIKEIIE